MDEYIKSTKHIVNAFKPPLVPMTPRKPPEISDTKNYKPKYDDDDLYTFTTIQMPYYGADGQILCFY